jgi:Dna[CI] antecedent, DciA
MNHFRRNFKRKSKTASTFCEVKNLLNDFKRNIQITKTCNSKEIFEKWPEIIGYKFAKWTVPMTFENNVLKIKVISSALYSLLVNYEKKRLLKVLQTSFPDASIKDIKFLIG